MFNYHHFRDPYKEKKGSSLMQNTQRNPLHLLVCLLFSPSTYFCHPIAISSSLLPRFFNLTSFPANTEFIFVSQTFLGWGLLGNGCMKDVSRARRDVWIRKWDKNSQTPNVVLLFYVRLMIEGKSSSVDIYLILPQSHLSDSTFIYPLPLPFCRLSVTVWEWDQPLQRVQQVRQAIRLLYI